jgi:hypothetical protein
MAVFGAIEPHSWNAIGDHLFDRHIAGVGKHFRGYNVPLLHELRRERDVAR